VLHDCLARLKDARPAPPAPTRRRSAGVRQVARDRRPLTVDRRRSLGWEGPYNATGSELLTDLTDLTNPT